MIDTMIRMEPDYPTERLAGFVSGAGDHPAVLGHRLAHSLFGNGARTFQYAVVSAQPITMLLRSQAAPALGPGWSSRSTNSVDPQQGDRLDMLVKVVAEIHEHRGYGIRGKRRDLVSHAKGLADNIGKPEPQVMLAAATDWFERLGERKGFKLVKEEGGTARIVVRDREQLSFRHKTGQIQAHPLTVEAQIEVIDREAFMPVLSEGIGRLRAYGYGLVQLKRSS